MSSFRILCLGDVVGADALAALRKRLPALRKELGADLVIVNGENARLGAGNGLTPDDAETIFAAGADVVTGGNHTFAQRSLYTMLDDKPELLRPLNCAPGCPGHGELLLNAAGTNILILNALGRVYMDPCDDPFRSIDAALRRYEGQYDFAVLDFHAEATSEKFAVASAFDGRIGLIFGTHTHVPTADEQILPGGSAYITDLGMCGPAASCLGVAPGCIIEKLRTGMPQRFELSKNPIVLHGILVELSGMKATSIKRVTA